MFLEITKFELHYHRQQYLIYIMAGVTFLLFFLAAVSPNVQIGVGGNINLNAAMAVINMLGAVSIMTILASIAFTANSVVRDYDFNTIEFFLSRPYNKASLIYGRYLGSFLFGLLVFVAGLMGILLGELMPWIDQERLGPLNLSAYFYGLFVIGIPNLFIFSSIFFCVAAVTRSLGLTYAIAVGLLLLSAVVDSFVERETVMITSMLDPFGASAMDAVTRYWTPYEQNTKLPVIEGVLLLNRVVWVLIGAGFLALSYWLFPTSINRKKPSNKKVAKLEEPHVNESVSGVVDLPKVTPSFGWNVQFAQFYSQTKIEITSIIGSVPFVIIMLLGMVQVVGSTVGDLGNIVGTSVYPTTSYMVSAINGSFSLPLLVVLVYISAEMMARESSTRSNELIDAMPFPNWIMIAAKWVGLAAVIVMMLLAVMLAAIGVQLYKGYFDINVLQYLTGLLFFFQFPLYLMITMSLFFYVVSRNKYIAMFLMVAYFMSGILLPALGFQHYLYRFNQVGTPFSDFTGYGQNLVPHLWQTFYWGLFGCLMLLAVHLLWPRGMQDSWANRVKVAKLRLTKNVVVLIWAVTTSFACVGTYIYFNTNILNTYRSSDDYELLQADYERSYKRYEDLGQPEITRVYSEIDIYPKRREVALSGFYDLVNRTDKPIEELHLTDPLEVKVLSMDVPGSELEHDERLHYRVYKLAQPLLPGETIKVKFDIAWLTPGFANNGHSVKLATNGTFFDNTDIFPLLGYQAGAEIQDNNDRRKYDLAPIQRMRDLDDPQASSTVAGFGGERLEFEVIVSTSVGQTAIAPGYLKRDWQQDGRHYFHYKMDAPIWNFFSVISADYKLLEDQWQDVALEIYYIHDYNVDTMMESAKDSLAYFSENFSPYQYRQFRIMEFPQFQGSFAQSFPNTIPFSEGIGFTADLRDKTKLDYVYYVTAHEAAHQWWAHQVLGANVQGSSLIVETLAQYSALMVMEKKFGRDHMQRFLSFELDSYLRGRGGEAIEELPLYKVENQPYIHYRKGSVVFYALKDLIGEQAINDALSTFIDQYAFKGAPYPTTRDLLALIRARAGDEYQQTITDLFERMILFDLRINEVAMEALDNGQYEVSFQIAARKFEANPDGSESQVEIDDWVDVGVLGAESEQTQIRNVIHIEKAKLAQETQRFSFIVEDKPFAVGIDPLNKLIDRNPDDNVKEI